MQKNKIKAYLSKSKLKWCVDGELVWKKEYDGSETPYTKREFYHIESNQNISSKVNKFLKKRNNRRVRRGKTNKYKYQRWMYLY